MSDTAQRCVRIHVRVVIPASASYGMAVIRVPIDTSTHRQCQVGRPIPPAKLAIHVRRDEARQTQEAVKVRDAEEQGRDGGRQ